MCESVIPIKNYITGHNPNVQNFGIFQKYPAGVFNPAFTGMFLLDYTNYKDLSDYKICKFHCIKSGIILYGNEAFVFTPLTNNDINSYIKIMLRNQSFLHAMTKPKATKLIVDYIRCNCQKPVIPCLHIIKKFLSDIIGLSESTFKGDSNSFHTLLFRIYTFMYMLHYNMPLQRKNTPGKRNLSSSVYCGRRKGWYSYLSGKEQKILAQESIFVSSNAIPDDLINGIAIGDLINSAVISSDDHNNNCMIRDGSYDCLTFQQDIKLHAHKYAETKKKSAVTGERRKVDELEEVPNIHVLKKKVQSYMVGWQSVSATRTCETWNQKFHNLIVVCGIQNYYLPSKLPECYKAGSSCGHVLHVDLEESASNTLHLTMLESVGNHSSHPLEVASSFVDSLIFENPVWDLGLQFAIQKSNSEKLFNLQKESAQKYLSTCICPCSSLFSFWHERSSLSSLPEFIPCEGSVFKDPTTFLKHLHFMRHDYYHRIIMRQVQNLYSSLIAKLKIPDWNTTHSLSSTVSAEQSIPKGKVSLPTYVFSHSKYDTFTVQR